MYSALNRSLFLQCARMNVHATPCLARLRKDGEGVLCWMANCCRRRISGSEGCKSRSRTHISQERCGCVSGRSPRCPGTIAPYSHAPHARHFRKPKSRQQCNFHKYSPPLSLALHRRTHHKPYGITDNSVVLKKPHATFALIGPSFSLAALPSCHAETGKKVFHFRFRSATEFQASI